jgi:hypothetical protein
LDDAAFLEAFEARTLPKKAFNHRGHIRAAWMYVRAHGREEGRSYFRQALLGYVNAVGVRAIYNETLTCVWLHVVADAVEASDRRASPERDFDHFLRDNPHLIDRRLPCTFYSEEALTSDRARAQFVDPDRKPLP